MVLKDRILKRVYEINQRALEMHKKSEAVLRLTNELIRALKTEDWDRFLDSFKDIDLYPETAELAFLSGLLKEEGEETCQMAK